MMCSKLPDGKYELKTSRQVFGEITNFIRKQTFLNCIYKWISELNDTRVKKQFWSRIRIQREISHEIRVIKKRKQRFLVSEIKFPCFFVSVLWYCHIKGKLGCLKSLSRQCTVKLRLFCVLGPDGPLSRDRQKRERKTSKRERKRDITCKKLKQSCERFTEL